MKYYDIKKLDLDAKITFLQVPKDMTALGNLRISYLAVEQDLQKYIARGEEGVFRRRVIKLLRQRQRQISEEMGDV